jgi:hypothetical protein
MKAGTKVTPVEADVLCLGPPWGDELRTELLMILEGAVDDSLDRRMCC